MLDTEKNILALNQAVESRVSLPYLGPGSILLQCPPRMLLDFGTGPGVLPLPHVPGVQPDQEGESAALVQGNSLLNHDQIGRKVQES